MSSTQRQPKVVIVGGGFAGLNAATALKNAPVELTIVDRRNHHLFQPLLYQVATAALAAPDIAAPIRKVLRRQSNTTVLLGEAERIEPDRRAVVLDCGEIEYDYLILAAGAEDSYFGNDEWVRHAPGLKTTGDALEIRRRILLAFETAEHRCAGERRDELLSFVVVGGGPTGVELAGALTEIARRTMLTDFRNIDPSEARVILVEGQDRILPAYDSDLSESARRQLEGLGVEVRTGEVVEDIREHEVRLKSGQKLRAATILWAAGVQASPLAASIGAELDAGGRIIVDQDLSVPGYPEIFVAGDIAAVRWTDERTVPGLAPAAIQMGRHAARNIIAIIGGRPTRSFTYVDKGMLSTIGRSRAVAQIRKLKIDGWLAWILWLIVHIFFLIGFRNRISVLLDWAIAYITFQRSSRIIIERDERRSSSPEASLTTG